MQDAAGGGGGLGSDGYGQTRRKRFRLDMDLGGSDSDSSCEQDGLAPSSASRGEYADDYRQIAGGMEVSKGSPFGSTGQYLDESWTKTKPPLVTPDHVGASNG